MRIICLLFLLACCTPSSLEISVWTTTADKSSMLAASKAKLTFENNKGNPPAIIEIDSTTQFQTMDGFGFALTGGSAYLIHEKLTLQHRESLLKELFLTNSTGIGLSYLRISIGASDLDDHVFSYDDLPSGQEDLNLAHFSLDEDQNHLIPVLKEIIALQPGIKIMGSPWSAPAWMKTNGSPKGGSLDPQYYYVYALYFVKYIQAMAAEGITIDAITLQNEPENPKNNPSMLMTADEEAHFVAKYLGPLFQKNSIKTKIIVFDHNCDHPEYPLAVLNDAEAKKFVDGSAFHLYLGEIEALSTVHAAHPDRNIYFTEQWTSMKGKFDGDLKWHVKNLVVGASRNWSKNVLEWNLAADTLGLPHTEEGGCTECLGALTIGTTVSRNVSYYIIGHVSKFVHPGAVRVSSTESDGLPNVSFKNPTGEIVLIVLNDGDAVREFGIKFNNKVAVASLEAGAVATYVWKVR